MQEIKGSRQVYVYVKYMYKVPFVHPRIKKRYIHPFTSHSPKKKECYGIKCNPSSIRVKPLYKIRAWTSGCADMYQFYHFCMQNQLLKPHQTPGVLKALLIFISPPRPIVTGL